MKPVTILFYASAVGTLTALFTGSYETLPIFFAVVGLTFAVSAGVVLFRS